MQGKTTGIKSAKILQLQKSTLGIVLLNLVSLKTCRQVTIKI